MNTFLAEKEMITLEGLGVSDVFDEDDMNVISGTSETATPTIEAEIITITHSYCKLFSIID